MKRMQRFGFRESCPPSFLSEGGVYGRERMEKEIRDHAYPQRSWTKASQCLHFLMCNPSLNPFIYRDMLRCNYKLISMHVWVEQISAVSLILGSQAVSFASLVYFIVQLRVRSSSKNPSPKHAWPGKHLPFQQHLHTPALASWAVLCVVVKYQSRLLFLASSWQRFSSTHGDANWGKEHLQFTSSCECRSLAASAGSWMSLVVPEASSIRGDFKNGSVPGSEPLHCQANVTNGVLLMEQTYRGSLYLVDRVV